MAPLTFLLTNVNQPLRFLLRIRTGSAYLHGLIAAGSITSLTALRSLLMIVRAGGWLAEVITCNLQMSESTGMVRVRNVLTRAVRTSRGLVANCAESLWLRLQKRPDLSPLSGRQAQGHTGVISE